MGFGYLPAFKNERKTIGGIIRSINNIYDHLNVEIKQHDVHNPIVSIDTVPAFFELTDIGLGITGTSGSSIDTGYRDGSKIRVKTINVKAKVSRHGSNSNDCNIMGIYLLKHYDNNLGGFPSWNDIYDQHTGADFYYRLRNNDHKAQYKILDSRIIKLSDVNDKDSVKIINMYHKTRRSGSHVSWEGGDGDDPSNGKYYLVVVSDQTSTFPTIVSSTRVTYVDN